MLRTGTDLNVLDDALQTLSVVTLVTTQGGFKERAAESRAPINESQEVSEWPQDELRRTVRERTIGQSMVVAPSLSRSQFWMNQRSERKAHELKPSLLALSCMPCLLSESADDPYERKGYHFENAGQRHAICSVSCGSNRSFQDQLRAPPKLRPGVQSEESVIKALIGRTRSSQVVRSMIWK